MECVHGVQERRRDTKRERENSISLLRWKRGRGPRELYNRLAADVDYEASNDYISQMIKRKRQ